MPKGASARRYAQAVFNIASERSETDKWLADLGLLANAMQNADFAGFLDAPQLTAAQKRGLIQDALSDSVGPLALNLMSLLASRGSARLVPAIAESYQRLLDAANGIERAEIVSATPLSDDRRDRIVAMLGQMVDGEVVATARVEPDIMGGFIARVGDKVLDGSVRTRFNQLRRELT